MNKNKRTLYLDMDGVVADWNGEAIRFLNLHCTTDMWNLNQSHWVKLVEHDRFYKDLPLLPGALELVTWAKNFTKAKDWNLAFLTAIPYKRHMPFVYFDKIQWAGKYFPGIPVLFGPTFKEKQFHCRPGDVLIDDRLSNCEEWLAKGGIAHQYSDWKTCKDWIAMVLDYEHSTY